MQPSDQSDPPKTAETESSDASRKTQAEIRKLEAEARKLQAELDRLPTPLIARLTAGAAVFSAFSVSLGGLFAYLAYNERKELQRLEKEVAAQTSAAEKAKSEARSIMENNAKLAHDALVAEAQRRNSELEQKAIQAELASASAQVRIEQSTRALHQSEVDKLRREEQVLRRELSSLQQATAQNRAEAERLRAVALRSVAPFFLQHAVRACTPRRGGIVGAPVPEVNPLELQQCMIAKIAKPEFAKVQNEIGNVHYSAAIELATYVGMLSDDDRSKIQAVVNALPLALDPKTGSKYQKLAPFFSFSGGVMDKRPALVVHALYLQVFEGPDRANEFLKVFEEASKAKVDFASFTGLNKQPITRMRLCPDTEPPTR